jgi:hypothetical protein
MRVVAVCVIVVGNQQVARQLVGDGDHRAGFAEFDQELLHLRLEVETVPETRSAFAVRDDIAARLPIGVRVDARAHQAAETLDQVAADFPRCVGDHAGRSDDGHTLLRARAKGCERRLARQSDRHES